jgi:hypothetical protein
MRTEGVGSISLRGCLGNDLSSLPELVAQDSSVRALPRLIVVGEMIDLEEVSGVLKGTGDIWPPKFCSRRLRS